MLFQRRGREVRIQLYQFLDIVLLLVVFIGCYYVRSRGYLDIEDLIEGRIPSFRASFFDYAWMMAVLAPMAPFILEKLGFYSNTIEKTLEQSLSQIIRAGLWLLFIVGLLSILFKLEVPSRAVLLSYAASAPAVLLVRERATAWFAMRALRSGDIREPIIVAGDIEGIEKFCASLTPLQQLEVDIVERVDVSNDVAKLVEAMHKHSVGRVILASSKMNLYQVQATLHACEIEGVDVWLESGLLHTAISKPTVEKFGGHTMLMFRAKEEMNWEYVCKVVLDRVASALALLVIAPLLLVVALVVRFTSKGPVIFSQQRAGLHGEPFTMYKFRSMCEDAEAQKTSLAAFNEMEGNTVFKMKNDPRITPVGRFLRKWSIDELPQLFNVLRGEMSLVGPRPLPLEEVASFDSFAWRRRLSVKPGLTCLWQVNGRSSITDFRDWVKLDLEYIDNWSFLGDIVILLRTIPVVLFARGAK